MRSRTSTALFHLVLQMLMPITTEGLLTSILESTSRLLKILIVFLILHLQAFGLMLLVVAPTIIYNAMKKLCSASPRLWNYALTSRFLNMSWILYATRHKRL